jgi:predicted metal-dependent enzyme (double-stranded beta helix superfamily)
MTLSAALPSASFLRSSRDATTQRTGSTALAAALAAVSTSWLHLVRYRTSTRWTHLLPADAVAAVLDPSLHDDLVRAQVWLLSWLPDQGTPLHDHGSSAGAFAVVRGSLTEAVVAIGRDGAPARRTSAELTGGRLRHFGAHHVHQVTNLGAEPAVSVHVYTPGLTVMNTYRVDDGVLVRTGTERAGVDW